MQASVICLRCRYQTQHPGIRVAPCPVWQSSTIPIVKFNQQNLAAQQCTHRNINHITLATLGANHRQFQLSTSTKSFSIIIQSAYWQSSSSSHSSKHKLYPKPPKSSADQYQLQSSYVWILMNVIKPQWS